MSHIHWTQGNMGVTSARHIHTIIHDGHNAVASCDTLNPYWFHIEITIRIIDRCILACVALK